MSSLDSIHEIIDRELISTLYQPIVSANQTGIHGFEALSRGPSDSLLHSPSHLFEAAQRVGRLVELEQVCLRSAARQFRLLNLPGKLFLNVGAETLIQPEYQQGRTLHLLREFDIRPEQVVLELTEQSPITDTDRVINAISYFHSLGIQIALDDLGSGYSSLRLWSEIRPDYIKIDRHFVSQIDLDDVKREFVRSIIEIARSVNAKIIAEGVETEAEMEVLLKMQVPLLQGYFIDRPKATPVCDWSSRRWGNALISDASYSANSLIASTTAVFQNTPVLDILQQFRQQVELNSIAVLDRDTPVGIIHRTQLMELLSRPYNPELHAKKSASHIMDGDPLRIDISLRLEQASRLVTSRARFKVEEDFILVREQQFVGIGQVIDLLRQITELQVKTVRHANPLTMLPGNIPINDCINRLLQEAEPFVACYFDLDYFKPYNDIYGYAKGDEALLAFAGLLKKRVSGAGDFLGHIGGDDFIAVFRRQDWLQCMRDLLREFDQLRESFYRQDDLERNGLRVRDREGVERFFPLLSISAGAVQIHSGNCQHAGELSALLNHVKQRSKAEVGSVLVVQDGEQVQILTATSES